MEISVDDMYKIENKGHDMGFLKKFMMENAGAAAVRRLIEKFGSVEGKNIAVFAGMGNNGGDALVMARHLAGHNANVKVALLGPPDKIKTEESKWNWSILEKMKSVELKIVNFEELAVNGMQMYHLIGKNVGAIELEVDSENIPARKLYSSLGFQLVSETEWYELTSHNS